MKFPWTKPSVFNRYTVTGPSKPFDARQALAEAAASAAEVATRECINAGKILQKDSDWYRAKFFQVLLRFVDRQAL